MQLFVSVVSNGRGGRALRCRSAARLQTPQNCPGGSASERHPFSRFLRRLRLLRLAHPHLSRSSA